MTAESESNRRHIAFEGCYNFRDLGGYRTHEGRAVRWRHLFRSDSPHRMTDDDVALARGRIGIATVIDLRQPQVVARRGSGRLVEPPVRFHRCPFTLEDEAQVVERFQTLKGLDEAYIYDLAQPQTGRCVAAVLGAIAELDAGPAVFFCSLGKDRTGVLSAVILGALGVVDEDIVADYALSDAYVGRVYERTRANPDAAKLLDRIPPQFFEARAETMEAVLASVRREYGSMGGYVAAQGVAPSVLRRRLEDTLLV